MLFLPVIKSLTVHNMVSVWILMFVNVTKTGKEETVPNIPATNWTTAQVCSVLLLGITL